MRPVQAMRALQERSDLCISWYHPESVPQHCINSLKPLSRSFSGYQTELAYKILIS